MQNLQSYRRVWGQEKATLEADGRYPFLNQQGLCDIYEWIFLNAMSEVCRVYPRRITQYYDLVMRTLSMSCPEVARMISFQLIWVEAGIVQEHIEKQELAAIRGKIECLREEEYRRKRYADCEINPLSGLAKWTFVYRLMKTITLQGINLTEMKILREKYSSLTADDEETYSLWNEEFKAMDHDLEYENVAVQCIFEYYMDTLKGKSLYINVVKLFIMLILIQTFEVIDNHIKGRLTIEDRSLIVAQVSRVVEHSNILENAAKNIVDNNAREALYKMICVFDS